MTRRTKVAERRLVDLEAEFSGLLRRCLKECAAGRWGLFEQNQGPEAERWLHWPEARELKEMAEEIQSTRQTFGSSNRECERFLHYRSLRGSHVPGEPKLASALLEELENNAEERE